MSTAAKATSRARVNTAPGHDDPLTLFGRPWRASSAAVPFLAWVILAGIAIGVAMAQESGAVPTDWRFWTTGSVIAVFATAAGLMFGFLGEHHQPLIRLWCLTTPLAGSLWVLYALLDGLHDMLPWVAWAALLGLGELLYIHARQEQHNHEFDYLSGAAAQVEAEAAAEAARARAAAAAAAAAAGPPPPPPKTEFERIAEGWESLFDVAGAKGLEFFDRKPNKAGFTLHLGLPDDGSVSYEQVRALAPKIELVFGKRLLKTFPQGSRPGCVRVQRARNDAGQAITGEIYVHVDVRDILAQTIRMPDEFTPISIYDAFQVGDFPNGDPCNLTIAEIHILMVGATRKGKSNLLNLMTRQVARCYDAVIWVYDGKGGRFVRPWLKPMLDKDIDPRTGVPLDRPIFDWVSINLTEFERQIDAAIEIATHRPLLPTASGSGHRATREDPALLLLGDELSEAAGSNGASSGFVDQRVNVTSATLQNKLARLARLGAGEGVYMAVAQQRGTVTSGMSGDGKSQFGGRILLPVKPGEAGEVLTGADPETIRLCTTLQHPGTAVIEGFGHDEALPAKLWLVGERDEIEKVVRKQVRELTYIRPVLHPDVANMIAKFGYGDRWTDPDRTAWLHGRQPSAPLLRWNAADYGMVADPYAKPTNQDATADAPLARTRAEALGLADVPDPFAPPQPAAPAVPAQRLQLTDTDAAREWAAREAELEREYADRITATDPAAPAVPAPAAPFVQTAPQFRKVEPIFKNVWPTVIEIVDAKPNGMTPAEIGRELARVNLKPSSRGTVNDWCDKLADAGKLIKSGENRDAMFYTPRNWKKPEAAA